MYASYGGVQILAIYLMNQAGATYLPGRCAAFLRNWYVAVELTAGAGFCRVKLNPNGKGSAMKGVVGLLQVHEMLYIKP